MAVTQLFILHQLFFFFFGKERGVVRMWVEEKKKVVKSRLSSLFIKSPWCLLDSNR